MKRENDTQRGKETQKESMLILAFMCVCSCTGKPEVNLKYHCSNAFHLEFWGPFLAGYLCLPPQCLTYMHMSPFPGFWGRNSGLHACMTNTLLTNLPNSSVPSKKQEEYPECLKSCMPLYSQWQKQRVHLEKICILCSLWKLSSLLGTTWRTLEYSFLETVALLHL